MSTTRRCLLPGCALIMVLAVAACATADDPMRTPIDAADENRFHASVQALEGRLAPADMEALRDALAVLLVTDLEADSRTDFFRSRIDGRSPETLIEEAARRREEFGLRTVDPENGAPDPGP